MPPIRSIATAKQSLKSVDAYVDEALNYATGITAELLKSLKFWFGTEFESKTPQEQHALLWRDEDSTEDSYKELELERDDRTAEVDRTGPEYGKGWNDGYWSIHTGKVPPDLDVEDKSAYAEGVREGAATALDEMEAWAQKWHDPLLMLLGTHPSRTLGKNLERAGEPRPSPDHDAHHIVAWRHPRAAPARRILEKWDIPLHGNASECANGMWSPRKFHATLANNYEYMDVVTRTLKQANSRERALEILREIRTTLSKLQIPK